MKISEVFRKVKLGFYLSFGIVVLSWGVLFWLVRYDDWNVWAIALCFGVASMVLGAFTGTYAIIKSGLKHNLFSQDTFIPK